MQRRDLEAWRGYAFRRRVLREKLDRSGAAKFRQTLVFEVEPRVGGFDERLVDINGRAPTSGEVRSHRSAGRFAKHYREMITGEADHDLIGSDLSLPSILDHASYHLQGREVVAGTPCYRLEIRSRPRRRTSTSQDLADATEGFLWVSVDGLHLVRWDTHLVRSVSKGIARVEQLDLRVELAPRGGFWIPRSIELDSEVKIGPLTLRKRNRYHYSHFRLQELPRAPGRDTTR